MNDLQKILKDMVNVFLAKESDLQEYMVDAKVDVYPGDVHAFDLLLPWKKTSQEAKNRLCKEYERLMSR